MAIKEAYVDLINMLQFYIWQQLVERNYKLPLATNFDFLAEALTAPLALGVGIM